MSNEHVIEISTLEGTITAVHSEEKGTSKSGKDWRKFTFIVEKGTQKVCATFFNKCNQERMIKVGQKIILEYYPESREHNGRWYTEIKVTGVRPIKEFTERVSNHADWM